MSILSYCVHRVPKQLRGKVAWAWDLSPVSRSSARLPYPPLAGRWARSQTGRIVQQSNIPPWYLCFPELTIVISLHSRVGLSCQMAASPASGFWHVCKCPGSIYRKLSFGSLLPFMVAEGPLLASFRIFCQVFLFVAGFRYAFPPIKSTYMMFLSLPPSTSPHHS